MSAQCLCTRCSSRSGGIATIGPGIHLFLLNLTLALLNDTAKLGYIALNSEQILICNRFPFGLQRGFQLCSELSELFLIHRELLCYEMADDSPVIRHQIGTAVDLVNGDGDGSSGVEAAETGESDAPA